jgi:hypothetical protein
MMNSVRREVHTAKQFAAVLILDPRVLVSGMLTSFVEAAIVFMQRRFRAVAYGWARAPRFVRDRQRTLGQMANWR